MSDPDPHVLACFLPIFEHPDFSPGYWAPMRRGEDGVYIAGGASLSSEASSFVTAAYRAGWVLDDFDWVKWKDSREARRLYFKDGALAAATPLELAQMLTMFIRQDRFVEGGLLGDFESGHILAIVRRAAQLAAEDRSTC